MGFSAFSFWRETLAGFFWASRESVSPCTLIMSFQQRWDIHRWATSLSQQHFPLDPSLKRMRWWTPMLWEATKKFSALQCAMTPAPVSDWNNLTPNSGQPCLTGLQRCKLKKCAYNIITANGICFLHGLIPLATFVIHLPPPALSVQPSLAIRAQAVKQKERHRLICLMRSCSSR